MPWKNCVAFNSDTAAVMVGNKNSVLSRIRQVQPDIIDLGCICHQQALCVGEGVKALPLSVTDLMINVYYHFELR